MAKNKRVFYACEAVFLQPVNKDGAPVGSYEFVHGLQSAGMSTNFNLEKIFQLGQLSVYSQMENNPEVEMTLSKMIDGTKTLYESCMKGGNASKNSLVENSENRVNAKFVIYSDTGENLSPANCINGLSNQAGKRYVECTGMYVSNLSYTFPTDGISTEEVTLVGTNRTWNLGGQVGVTQDETPQSMARRWNFNVSKSQFPIGPGGMEADAPISNVSISMDLGREPVYTLGSYEAYTRSVSFPIEITCEIESLVLEGDNINLNEVSYGCGTSSSNTLNYFPIKFTICLANNSEMVIDLGKKNKLNSISYGGGESGGGNLTATYSFTTDNTFSLTHTPLDVIKTCNVSNA